MYRIGIIDGIKSECADIQASVLKNAGFGVGIEFKEYELVTRTREDILAEIRKDVDAGNIHTLIIDFNITANVIKGWEVIKFLHQEIPEFPAVVISNVPDESKESPYIDADKVYAKMVFLRPELDSSKELVRNIMLNMEKFTSRRKELENRLEIELKKLDENGENQDALERVIQIESELSRYKQLYQTRVDRVLDMSDLRDAFEALGKYEQSLST